MREEINPVMSKVKVVMTVLGALMVLSAMSAASASAEWLVNGAPLVGSAALSPKALVDEFSTLLVPTLGLSIQCTGHFLDGSNPVITAPNLGSASSLTFLGCSTTAPASGCALAEENNEPIETTGILATAYLGAGESVRILFKPETKGTFANIKFSEKNTCAFNMVEAVKGQLVANSPDGQLELLAHILSGLGSAENNSLEIGGDKAYLDGGAALLTLASDSKWSFM